MGLLRASLIFVIGTFSISLLKTHLKKIDEIPIVGPMFGDDIKKYIKKNKEMALLVIICLIELIL